MYFNLLTVSVDISNTVFGILATFLAVGGIWATIWATRRYRNTTNGQPPIQYFQCLYFLTVIFLERDTVHVGSHEDPPDIELGLLADTSPNPTTQEDDPEYRTLLRSPADASDHRQTVHEVIGDALEVFSKHLRAQR
jgi:hypothetical protein